VSDFVGTDPRGVRVILLDKTWTSKIQVTHPEVGTASAVHDALSDPDVILNNQTGTFRKGRAAGECYVRESAAHGGCILVAVSVLTEPLIVGNSVVEPPSRKAVTAYVVPSIPNSKRVWTKSS
jgi:hypothetical protein